MRELVHALMRHPQETSCIACAHLQFSGSQDPDGDSSRSRCTSIFLVGLPHDGGAITRVIHTDARRRSIQLDKLKIDFKHTAPSKLYWAGRPGMRVVQALH